MRMLPAPSAPDRTLVDLSDLSRSARKTILAERLARRTADFCWVVWTKPHDRETRVRWLAPAGGVV